MDSFDELRANVEDARREYQAAFEAQREVFRQYSGLPHPDGPQHVHHAAKTLKQAQLRYSEAMDKLTKHVLERSRATHPSLSSKPLEILLVDDNIAEWRMIQEKPDSSTVPSAAAAEPLMSTRVSLEFYE